MILSNREISDESVQLPSLSKSLLLDYDSGKKNYRFLISVDFIACSFTLKVPEPNKSYQKTMRKQKSPRSDCSFKEQSDQGLCVCLLQHVMHCYQDGLVHVGLRKVTLEKKLKAPR